MAARFTTLSNALDKNFEGLSPKAAVTQIEYWEDQLKSVEVSGVKGLLGDLHSLKMKLSADPIDEEAIKKLVGKIGGETGRIAGRTEDEKISAKLEEVGQKLEAAGK
ncbi:hypothetical protein BH09PSE2_BH09PSE2_05280 [soil metagenome]